jgi:hypothetical protein
MKKLYVSYWIPNESQEKDMGIKHNQAFPYSIEKRNEIIDIALSKNYNVMLKKVVKTKALLIMIDDRSFQQR